MNQAIQKQLKALQKKEDKFLEKKGKIPVLNQLEKLEQWIPATLTENLKKAFYFSFKLVFEKGTGIIEKTYQKEKIRTDYDIKNYAFEKRKNRKALKELDHQSSVKNRMNLGITAFEGTALGILGIGLPDIPVFLAVLLKGIYEIALSYGFSYDTEKEKYYILCLIETALISDEKKQEGNRHMDQIAYHMRSQIPLQFDIEIQLKTTANAMAMDMLYTKFVQGLPIIGIIGGLSNIVYFNKITEYAKLKYKKRYLLQKETELQ